ncbi:MAG: hypothetical protein HUK20_06265 [Fibrobacter sp.]|nr:hypothetical protein [Fibrobacter sp.]
MKFDKVKEWDNGYIVMDAYFTHSFQFLAMQVLEGGGFGVEMSTLLARHDTVGVI